MRKKYICIYWCIYLFKSPNTTTYTHTHTHTEKGSRSIV